MRKDHSKNNRIQMIKQGASDKAVRVDAATLPKLLPKKSVVVVQTQTIPKKSPRVTADKALTINKAENKDTRKLQEDDQKPTAALSREKAKQVQQDAAAKAVRVDAATPPKLLSKQPLAVPAAVQNVSKEPSPISADEALRIDKAKDKDNLRLKEENQILVDALIEEKEKLQALQDAIAKEEKRRRRAAKLKAVGSGLKAVGSVLHVILKTVNAATFQKLLPKQSVVAVQNILKQLSRVTVVTEASMMNKESEENRKLQRDNQILRDALAKKRAKLQAQQGAIAEEAERKKQQAVNEENTRLQKENQLLRVALTQEKAKLQAQQEAVAKASQEAQRKKQQKANAKAAKTGLHLMLKLLHN